MPTAFKVNASKGLVTVGLGGSTGSVDGQRQTEQAKQVSRTHVTSGEGGSKSQWLSAFSRFLFVE